MLPLSRSSDPITSFQAADGAKAFIRTHEKKIIETLTRFGASGVDKIAFYSEIEPHAVGKRMRALHIRGDIELTGRTVKSESGRNQREWMAA